MTHQDSLALKVNTYLMILLQQGILWGGIQHDLLVQNEEQSRPVVYQHSNPRAETRGEKTTTKLRT